MQHCFVATNVFVAGQVDRARWKTGNIDENLQRKNVARQVSRISPPLHVTDSYTYGPWKQANSYSSSFSFSDQWTLSIDNWHLLNAIEPSWHCKETDHIFVIFFCFSTSPFDGLQSSIFWKYFDELKLCGKILSAFRCTCSQNQTPLEHSIFSEYCENTISLQCYQCRYYISL